MSEEKYHEGDLVEAVKGESVVRGRVELSPEYKHPTLALPALGAMSTPYLSGYVDHGYTITVIEKAKPPLPTEPGWYVDGQNDAWLLNNSGYWYCAASPGDDPAQYAPFTKLEPVAETARRVVAKVRSVYFTDDPTFWGNLDAVEEHFGATK
jgi:hypothetical protein